MGQWEYGSTSETRPNQVLRDVRGSDDPQEVRAEPDARGHGSVSESEELLSELREHQETGHEGRTALASAEAPTGKVQRVRVYERPARSPQGQKPSEQRSGEPADPVFFLPSETPLAGGPREEDGRRAEGSSNCGCALWGQYAPAIHRWEIRLGRVAPAPTQLSPKGLPRLSALAVEFMMGLPAGHVTDVPGLSRNEQLKALGNGVVPQQAYAALQLMTGAA